MDSVEDDSGGGTRRDDKKVEEAVLHDLLEEGWFFGKFLNKPRMSRCFSDPCPNIISDRNEGDGKERENGEVAKLARQLSDQILDCRKKDGVPEQLQGKERRRRRSTGLVRTPSLPAAAPVVMKPEEIEENDGEDVTMSRLIRQAMPNHSSDLLACPCLPNKGTMQNSITPKWKTPTSSEVESINVITKNQYPNQRRLRKSLSNIEEFQQVEKFKDLGFTIFDEKKELMRRPSVVVRKANYLTNKGRHGQSCAPPVPVWATKNSAEDIKAQLKFWARAVASNVR